MNYRPSKRGRHHSPAAFGLPRLLFGGRSLALKTAAAQHWPPHMRVKRDRCGLTAFRTVNSRLVLSVHVWALSLAFLAALGVVLELHLPKEGLFTSTKDKLLPASGAFQISV